MGVTANPLKSDDKYAQKSVQLVRGSSFRSDFLQNPYFNKFQKLPLLHFYSEFYFQLTSISSGVGIASRGGLGSLI